MTIGNNKQSNSIIHFLVKSQKVCQKNFNQLSTYLTNVQSYQRRTHNLINTSFECFRDTANRTYTLQRFKTMSLTVNLFHQISLRTFNFILQKLLSLIKSYNLKKVINATWIYNNILQEFKKNLVCAEAILSRIVRKTTFIINTFRNNLFSVQIKHEIIKQNGICKYILHSSSRSMDLEPPPKSPMKKPCLGGSGISCGWNSSPIISGRLWLKHRKIRFYVGWKKILISGDQVVVGVFPLQGKCTIHKYIFRG